MSPVVRRMKFEVAPVLSLIFELQTLHTAVLFMLSTCQVSRHEYQVKGPFISVDQAGPRNYAHSTPQNNLIEIV